VAFDNVNCAAPVDKLPVSLSQDVLDLMIPHTNNLARVLGVRILTMADLLMQVVFPDIEAAFYEHGDVEKLMIFVLRHYFTFLEQNHDFQEALRSLPFMPRKDILLTAERFYDPDDQLLRRVFIGEENFPFGAYADPTIVTVLRQIGLRGESAVEPEDLREACYQTEDMAQGRRTILHEKIELKSDALMEYIEKHLDILDVECDKKTLRECISDIGWVRRLTRKPAVYPRSLPWFTADADYHKPCDMVQKIHTNVAGSVLPIVAKDSDKIGNKFGWLNPPGAQHLVKHLANAVNCFKGTEKAMYLEITRAVYSELCQYSTEDVQRLFDENKLVNWVWNGDGFTSPQQIVFREPFMDLRPFVYTFPAELQPFSEFFGAFGARESCHLPNVLKLIKTKHDAAEVLHTSVTEVKKDLHVCVTILNELKSNVTEETLPSLQDELVLPLHTESSLYLKMAPLHDCTYCDHEWMRQGKNIDILPGCVPIDEHNIQICQDEKTLKFKYLHEIMINISCVRVNH
jgi:sacsin